MRLSVGWVQPTDPGVVAFARMRVGGDRREYPRSGERGYAVSGGLHPPYRGYFLPPRCESRFWPRWLPEVLIDHVLSQQVFRRYTDPPPLCVSDMRTPTTEVRPSCGKRR